MGWLIALGMITLVAVLPVGIQLIYNEDGLLLSLLVGVLKFKLYPGSGEKKEKRKSKEKKMPAGNAQKSKESQKQKKGGNLTEFLPLLDIALQFLGSFRRKIRISHLDMLLVMAGDDPCDLAINYGKAWTAIGNIMPLLDNIFVIKKRNVQAQCDFVADHTRLSARADVTITVGRVLSLLVVYGVKALREYLNIMKLRKGGTEK